ncbi:MAG: PLP-dependent aminotransferase family protein [Verrucomicrobiota bacterium]|nr:PLP-dependent aminotransferase family protein [Verrucomicrobiota bacterium]
MTPPLPFRANARLLDFMRQAGEPGLINLAAGVPGLDALPADRLRECIERALREEGAALFAYHHPAGDPALRDRLAERLRLRGAAVAGGQLITTTGCTQALQVMLAVLLQPGDIVAVEAPAYYGMLELLSQAGARVLPIPVRGDDGLDVEAAADALTRWRPRCLVVCSSLSNPSGATVPESNRERLVELCRELGVRIIEDDIYAELVDAGAPKPMLAYDDGSTVAYVSSFSKTVSPGLRVGVCVPGTLLEEFAARKCQQDLHSSVLSEVALREFLEHGALDSHLENLRQRNRRRRTLALAAIERSFPLGTLMTHPRGGYMLWAQLPRRLDLAEVRKRARVQGIVFAAGPAFFAGEPEQSYLRLNCAKATEEDLTSGLETLGQILSQT